MALSDSWVIWKCFNIQIRYHIKVNAKWFWCLDLFICYMYIVSVSQVFKKSIHCCHLNAFFFSEDDSPNHSRNEVPSTLKCPKKMYGLLLESVENYIKEKYGEDVWEKIRKMSHVETMAFSTHKRYSENIIPDIARACSIVLDLPEEEIMDSFGVSFVTFVGQYGYDKILSVLGRNMRDFLNGLDNLHEYLRFSYPKLRPPSFFCTNESTSGLTLHYRSKRKGFVHYVKGQIRQVGKLFYNAEIHIDVVSTEVHESMTHVVFRLHFENDAYKEEMVKRQAFASNSLPLNSGVFFNLFPFHIVFTRSFEIKGIGSGISAVFPSAKGQKINALFTLTRPLIDFKWDKVCWPYKILSLFINLKRLTWFYVFTSNIDMIWVWKNRWITCKIHICTSKSLTFSIVSFKLRIPSPFIVSFRNYEN